MNLQQFVLSFAVVLAVLQGFAASAAGDATADEAAQKYSADSLLWGPYKPNLYFALRPRIPKSLTAGLIWGGVDSYERFQNSMVDRSYFWLLPHQNLLSRVSTFAMLC